MTPKYSYISSIEFINKLEFEYIETYSLQRGTEFETESKVGFKEFEKLQKQLEKNGDLSEIEMSRLLMLKKLHGFTQYLINNNGEFHPSAEKTGTFKSDDQIIEKLKSILNTPIKEVPSWMCAPVYRDAIVFYDLNKEIISTLNVCLSCEYMETRMFNHINADAETYNLMREFFIELGHKVEEN
ncbi:hypothetical protein [Aureibacter tunicatorum]|uniref:Uncharacterized protein n=1 Tax=Aureibacter tunicatorum TaxID=866807 RepID=A0AAE3XPA2_9BACT|nr:hypothetical protein [Aureibacter tunicatorum]MDR6238774.1 hypothetical protein [Aureibacter tunicatorum]BDD05295.1 hypothetical protein AUTU_27780 [Aureibacter tunicatorum]